MKQLDNTNSIYRTNPLPVSRFAKALPEFFFYPQFLAVVFKAGFLAKRAKYDDAAWCESSFAVFRALERIGVQFQITGIDNLAKTKEPCIIIGNHISTLETIILPIIIEPIKRMTFIIKQSLLDYPVFKHIMHTRDPIAVTRTNPRQDLKAVLDGGMDRLKKGLSIMVFPQTTRTNEFDPAQFSSIGVKLAQKAKVPIVPLALKTDAWGNGKRLKDFGKIDPAQKVYFAFGEPLRVQNRGAEEHRAIIDFITSKLTEWQGR
ncbi:MAG TPA: 1-acyl-sn-glycerol-3-phosphate acyltransferase [Bacteroidetes bacterium]|nr:1-acyl-sn-glycerol-3-phosphate acyltransferase [Bacteroidota bacterium]